MSELLTFNNELTMSKVGQGYYSHKNTGSQQHREYHYDAWLNVYEIDLNLIFKD